MSRRAWVHVGLLQIWMLLGVFIGVATYPNRSLLSVECFVLGLSIVFAFSRSLKAGTTRQ